MQLHCITRVKLQTAHLNTQLVTQQAFVSYAGTSRHHQMQSDQVTKVTVGAKSPMPVCQGAHHPPCDLCRCQESFHIVPHLDNQHCATEKIIALLVLIQTSPGQTWDCGR